jgi:predicted DNA binding CopG/RHH family protein
LLNSFPQFIRRDLPERSNVPKPEPEDKELLDSFDRGEWQAVTDRDAEVARYRGYAAATFKKDKRVNIRLSQKDLTAIKKRALEEGIPYQTLISSIIHKYVSGRLHEKNS